MHGTCMYPLYPRGKMISLRGSRRIFEMIHFLETGRGEGGKEEKKKLVDDESAKEESDRPWLRAERVTGTERSGVERSQVVTDL